MTVSFDSWHPMTVAPAQVIRGADVLSQAGPAIAALGQRPLLVGGEHSLAVVKPRLLPVLADQSLQVAPAPWGQECSPAHLEVLQEWVSEHQADVIIGAGGGKALDAAKLIAHQCQLPVVTIPTSAATCAAWTALSNVYSASGGFKYDVSLSRCPDLLILDYQLILTASRRTLVAGIGDALAKWYEASVSSGHSQDTLVIAAVQQARVLRDILFQKSAIALEQPGGETWREVVDATVLMAGMIGGLGGAQCRTVAAHAVHNGLTHLPPTRQSLHGEKVAYGILVQLRIEEIVIQNHLAASARHQLLQFYAQIGLPTTLSDLKMSEIRLQELQRAAQVACEPQSDLHHLPFEVGVEQVLAAMVSTTAPLPSGINAGKSKLPSEATTREERG
jgi:glycerol dehydrogenase-like iron-containing ADH family enzyme